MCVCVCMCYLAMEWAIPSKRDGERNQAKTQHNLRGRSGVGVTLQCTNTGTHAHSQWFGCPFTCITSINLPKVDASNSVNIHSRVLSPRMRGRQQGDRH